MDVWLSNAPEGLRVETLGVEVGPRGSHPFLTMTALHSPGCQSDFKSFRSLTQIIPTNYHSTYEGISQPRG